jgi:hypothetical protein
VLIASRCARCGRYSPWWRPWSMSNLRTVLGHRRARAKRRHRPREARPVCPPAQSRRGDYSVISSLGRLTLSSCRPSPLHGRWRDWCRALVPFGDRCQRRLTRARYLTSWSQGRRGSCQMRRQWRQCHQSRMPPPRANAAAGERPMQRATLRTKRFFMLKLPRCRNHARNRGTFGPKSN